MEWQSGGVRIRSLEGVLAETGYRADYQMLERSGIMSGVQRVVALLRRDESRHVACGVHLLQLMVAAPGAPIRQVAEQRMNDLTSPTIGVIHEIFASYKVMRFGLVPGHYVTFATTQFTSRLRRIEATSEAA